VRSLAEWEAAGEPDTLSVVIPAYNEEGHIEGTVRSIVAALQQAAIKHEVLVVNDSSKDGTRGVLERISREIPTVRFVDNIKPNGFGFAVRRGLADFRGSAVAIVMADGSDQPDDLVAFWQRLQQGHDCVFGTRFSRGGKVVDYPRHKLVLNRIGNTAIRALFFTSYNDFSNAFKMYRRRVIAGIQPLLSQHFNLTVEMPLKALVRGYTYAVVPNTWVNRKAGVSKFKIREMGSRYFFIILYCLLERWLSRGDYKDRADLREGQLQVWPR
jgi:dolichol-phosphate mannosyltransferase